MAVVRPMPAVANAVPRYPLRASHPRRLGSAASGPPASLLSPVRASATPSIAAKADAPPPSTPVTKPGSSEVAISWPVSEKKDAAATLDTPGVSHPLGVWSCVGCSVTSGLLESSDPKRS